MKQKLLPGMKEMLKLGKKVQTMHAWGWFTRLLGSHAIKKRHLINKMLKIPEMTFSDHDPQVQIASLVGPLNPTTITVLLELFILSFQIIGCVLKSL